ncbi:MAG TPA: HEAT repeat domain-containing protein [Candidatus Brocadiaceae bacterium]|nr:HEAT repeat domain-containing protein [Candidatus Brocadiaceae bacterium]
MHTLYKTIESSPFPVVSNLYLDSIKSFEYALNVALPNFKILEVLVAGKLEAIEPLSAALEDKDSNIRIMAIKFLTDIKDANVLTPLMITAIKNKDVTVAEIAVVALGNIRTPRAIEALIAVINDLSSNYAARRSAADTLGKMGEVKAIEPLLIAMKDKEEYVVVKDAIVEALSKIARSVEEPLRTKLVNDLIANLIDKDTSTKIRMVKILGMIGDKKAREPLIKLSESDPDSNVRVAVQESLEKIRR